MSNNYKGQEYRLKRRNALPSVGTLQLNALITGTFRSFIQIPAKYIKLYQTRCRPSRERRCIPDVVLKNEGSMVQTCLNINVHVVNTDIC